MSGRTVGSCANRFGRSRCKATGVVELSGISRTVSDEMKAENGQTMPEPWHRTDKIQAETGMQPAIAWTQEAEVEQDKLPPFNDSMRLLNNQQAHVTLTFREVAIDSPRCRIFGMKLSQLVLAFQPLLKPLLFFWYYTDGRVTVRAAVLKQRKFSPKPF